jgi:hypothetical protein
MKNKKEKIEFVKEQLAKKEHWSHDLLRLDGFSAFSANWEKGDLSKDFELTIGGQKVIRTEDINGRSRSTVEPMSLTINKENAENLICILEAFLEAQS